MCMYCIHTNNNTNERTKTRNVVTLRVPTSEKQGKRKEKTPSQTGTTALRTCLPKNNLKASRHFFFSVNVMTIHTFRPEGKMRRNV